MEKGYTFYNSGMKLTCMDFYGEERRNVGLFLRASDGMYITARDTFKDPNSQYSWAWGHYFINLVATEEDFKNRVADLKKYI